MSNALEVYAHSLARSDYVGWVAYVDNVPIYEHVPFAQGLRKGGVGLAQPTPKAQTLTARAENRTTMEWRDLPHDKIQRVELYYARERVPVDRQPVIRFDREPGADLRFIQFKTGALLTASGMATKKNQEDLKHLRMGQERIPLISWTMGYWDKRKGECVLVEVTPNADGEGCMEIYGPVPHPCWPRPIGFGLAPHTVGLTESDIPAMAGG